FKARAAAAARRLDDAFRTYLGERGAKPVPMTDVSRLVGGVVGLRLAADAVLDLWSRTGADRGSCADGRSYAAAGGVVCGWYDAMASALRGGGQVPDPLPALPLEPAPSARLMWTGGHLDAARRLQPDLVAPARAVAAA
ncbi:hypothetical protein AB0M46_48300, partial [Dactylosporangium sp. NPDC051485]|uniref:hypothetical protein n=1 Tax=Dactylosporangium sp. NPDC051485 TaxID=3154846 RepID=UPI003431A98F